MKALTTIGRIFCGAIILTFSLNAQDLHANGDPTPPLAAAALISSPDASTLGQPTRGIVFKTAAINSDGTTASCFRCSSANTIHLGTGIYQIAFDENIQATNGWSRFVQVDTLSAGSLNAWCTTADRSGVPNAIFVSCQSPGGPGSGGNSKATDVSFCLFVAR